MDEPRPYVFEEEIWPTCKRVNQAFADALQAVLKPGDGVWVHDNRLFLLPRLLRRLGIEVWIGFFLHIPFPAFARFRARPR